MPFSARWVLLLGCVLFVSCTAPSLEQRRAVSVPAMSSPHAHLERAIDRYKKSMRQLSIDARTIVIGGIAAGGINHKYMRATFEEGEAELALVEADLAAASVDPNLAIELCIACWEIDWNGNGRIDHRDRMLFQIEIDADDTPIPEDDPRRKPTFRFDIGDVAWARAFVSFQRAALDFVLAYDWSAVDQVLSDDRGAKNGIVLRLVHPERIADAKQRILEGLDRSDDARRAYLAETDDDREWVPNPRQKNHPMPLPMDQALYDTWEGLLGDLRRLVRGDEGLYVADLILLGDQKVTRAPKGYVDIGSMLAHPHDITLTASDLKKLDRGRDVETALSALLGDHYVASMKASPLPRRLLRMKGEIDRREEGFERKLRYLFWIN